MKPFASIQVDLDGLGPVLDCYGHQLKDHETDVIYGEGVPNLLDLLKEAGVPATFFLIGNDAKKNPAHKVLKRLVSEKHELSNHTMTHPLHFAELSDEERYQEIKSCGDVIKELSGRASPGFRAPGYAIHGATLKILQEQGYQYDSSVFPCLGTPLIRLWQRLTSEARDDAQKYGNWRNGFGPMQPYHAHQIQIWKHGDCPMLEIPVSTYPVIRIPFHGSYLVALSQINRTLAWWYWLMGAHWYALRKMTYIFVIHPLELTPMNEDPRLKAQIGYRLPIDQKLDLYRKLFRFLKEKFTVVTSEDLVLRIQNN